MNKFKVYIRVCEDGIYPYGAYFRIRIIYPDGTAEYADADYFTTRCFYIPCWYRSGMTEKESIRAMEDYDKKYGFKTELLFKF